MQEALPYRIYTPSLAKGVISQSLTITKNNQDSPDDGRRNRIEEMVSENAVLLFGKQGCCMCHVMTQSLLVLGVNPVVCGVSEEDETGLVGDLVMIGRGADKGNMPQLPSVYIGGILFGDLDRLMAAHISGELLPILKKAGALWL